MFIFAMVMYAVGFCLLPESYAPVLVRRRAAELQAASTAEGGPMQYYIGKYDHNKKSNAEIIKINLVRPFKLLFLEPIVLLLSIYGEFSVVIPPAGHREYIFTHVGWLNRPQSQSSTVPSTCFSLRE